MSTDQIPPNGQTYRIGAVSRLTGVPADTLRVWERRYHVVTPVRSPSGTRLYGPEDVSRLSLIKQLVDRGDAISTVASLSVEQLRDRLRGAILPPMDEQSERLCRIVILGTNLPDRFEDAGSSLVGLDLVGVFRERERFLAEVGNLHPDVVVLEYPTIHLEQVREVVNLLAQSRAPRGVVVYNFATAATIERLESRRLFPKRAPVDAAELRRWCLTAHATTLAAYKRPAAEIGLDLGEPPPRRRFDDHSLSRIAAASPTVRCECPHHLVDLITNLSAFELYSEECEMRNVEDAALHAFLYAATARARSLMESALARVIEAEGISLDDEEYFSHE